MPFFSFLSRLVWRGAPRGYGFSAQSPTGSLNPSHFGGWEYHDYGRGDTYSTTYLVQYPQMAGKWEFEVFQQNHYLDTVNGDPWTLLYCDISGVCTEFSSGVGASGVVTYTVSF